MQKVNEIKKTDVSDLVNTLVNEFWKKMDQMMCYNIPCVYLKFYTRSDFLKYYNDIIVYYRDDGFKPTEVLLKAIELLEHYGYNVRFDSDGITISWIKVNSLIDVR